MHILGQALLGALDCWPPEPPLFRIFNVEESISCMPGLATKQENFRFLRNQVTHECLLMTNPLLPTRKMKNMPCEATKLHIVMQCPVMKRNQTSPMTSTLPYLRKVCHKM